MEYIQIISTMKCNIQIISIITSFIINSLNKNLIFIGANEIMDKKGEKIVQFKHYILALIRKHLKN